MIAAEADEAVPYGGLDAPQAVLLQPDGTVCFHPAVLLLTQLAWQKHAVVLRLQNALHIAWVKVTMLHAAIWSRQDSIQRHQSNFLMALWYQAHAKAKKHL